MLTILYSFNKVGFEAEYWTKEIAEASTENFLFIPFNHGEFIDPRRYIRAQLLDNLYYEKNKDLFQLYEHVASVIRKKNIDAMIVDTCPPYHPEFLKDLPVYKILRTSDGPLSTYDRDFAYLHAYDHVFYHSPAYSRDLTMKDKLIYCGAKKIDFWPLCLFDTFFSTNINENELFSKERKNDIVFVGSMFTNKVPLLADVRRYFKTKFKVYGICSFKKNLYFNYKCKYPTWIRKLPFESYIPLYQSAKIGINVHNRGKYTIGGYRLFDLPGNGVMQISDGGEYLDSFYDKGKEIIGYKNSSDLIDKIKYYLNNDDERIAIAKAGYRRVMRDHRLKHRIVQAGELIKSRLS